MRVLVINHKYMSNDWKYILHYESQSYVSPTPQTKDKETIRNHYAHIEEIEFLEFGNEMYFQPPKYLIPKELRNKLLADQVLERQDSWWWEQI